MRYGQRWDDASERDPHPYEHPALEPEPGFWDGKWEEFKRRFIQMAWEDHYSRTVLILSTVGFVATFIWMWFTGET